MNILNSVKNFFFKQEKVTPNGEISEGRLKEESPTDTVYCYNYKGIITITRSREGKWFYSYVPKKVAEYINKNKISGQRKINLRGLKNYRYEEVLEIGVFVGFTAKGVLEDCKISYGDKK